MAQCIISANIARKKPSRDSQEPRSGSGCTRFAPETAILILALAWRLALAVTLPCISRDGVTFCEYARALGERGSEHLRDPQTRQHPLYPMLVLAAQRLARFTGAPDSPLTWQRSGQAASILGGIVVVAFSGAIARRLVIRMSLPVSTANAGRFAMVLAAFLPLNTWHSADVMSDEIHLALYLAGVWVALHLVSVRAAIACGVLSSLAFLTRPEGILVAGAGLVAMASTARQAGLRRVLAQSAALVAGFVVLAAPYWTLTGKLSPKKDVLEWFSSIGGRDDCVLVSPTSTWIIAKVEPLQLTWGGLIPYGLYTVFRAGRIVMPLLAVLPIVHLGRRWMREPLNGYAFCMIGHFALALFLLRHHGYLDQRHVLVVVSLLIPLAALFLARIASIGPIWARTAFIGACIAPLALYSLRQPNFGDRYLVRAAASLRYHDEEIAERTILAGSSPRRVAFYTGATWLYWPEHPEHLHSLARQILELRPDYFALELGAGHERRGNTGVRDWLLGDQRWAKRVQLVVAESDGYGNDLLIFRFDWAPR